MRNMWSFLSYLGRLGSSLFTPAILERLSAGEKLELLTLEPVYLLPPKGEGPGKRSLQFPSFCNAGRLPRRQRERLWASAPGQPHPLSWAPPGPGKVTASALTLALCAPNGWPFLTSGLLSDLGATECWVMGSQGPQSDLGSTFPVLQVTNSPNLSSLPAIVRLRTSIQRLLGEIEETVLWEPGPVTTHSECSVNLS